VADGAQGADAVRGVAPAQRVLVCHAKGQALRDVLLVADDHAGELVGLAYGRPADGDAALTAEVSALYVDPTCHRQGIGAALLRAAALELSRLGLLTVSLEVLSVNLPAQAFYRHTGGHGVGQGTFDEDGYLLPVAIYEWAIGYLAK
jgi:ribosomal protein S18 acetylase RimI-like enzyme